MSREKRRGSPVLLAGLGGFALGAATVLFVVWVYGVRPAAPEGAAGALGAPGTATAPRTAEAPPTPGAVAAPGTSGAPRSGAGPGPQGSGPGSANLGGSTAGGATAAPGASPQAGSEPPAPATPGLAADIDVLERRHLLLPVQGLRREQLRDSFAESRGGHVHEALDIMAARGTPVLAVEDGRLAKLFLSAQGGNTIYQFDPAATYAYYYAHLERYADGLREGDELRRGQLIGYVGTTGNAPPNAPHLHFAIFRLTPDKHWWQGTAIDPYLVLKQP